MEKQHFKQYAGTPFSVEVTVVNNGEGKWDSNKVSIFRDGNLIGEYMRNYPSYGTLTFYPFEANNEWYALYSAHYTATRVLKLHEDKIEDWCGEEPSGTGFCPVEIYVPRYKETFHKDFSCYYVDNAYKDYNEFLNEKLESIKPVEFKYTNFGFLCGCIWGDDSSWKIRFIDLSQIPAKILSITDKFGYWEMPRNLTLKECIDMENWEPDFNWISLTKAEHINLDK